MRYLAPPFKGQGIFFNGNTVEFNSPQQALPREWYPAFLPGKAQQQGVRIDGIAQEVNRQGVGIDEGTTGSDGIGQFAFGGGFGKTPFRITYEFRCW